ncbi:MAG: (Fe-S)-binding protein [Desulfatiglans sp.]|nr:(Fe-S)-binding protein [Desulfatiglans sp.]
MNNIAINHNSNFFTILNRHERGDNVTDCLTCGICLSRCSWYDGEGGPNPRRMVRMAQLGLDNLLAQSPMIWDCMICNHCTTACPMGIRMADIVRMARGLPEAEAILPESIRQGIKTRLETGDVNGFSEDDFNETIEFLNEEIADENDDPDALIPNSIRGAKYLYLPNPRELSANLLHLKAMARLFHASGETWTMSPRHTDVTNWGYFSGDNEAAKKMALQIVEATEELEIETLVLSECGHGFFVLRNLIPELIGRNPGFNVKSIVEFALEHVKAGKIRLDKDAHPYPIMYHDPCNLGRKSGVFDAPRELLSLVCKEVVELNPNRENGICCGGGGGLLQDSTSTKNRMISGRAKADQMKSTGLKHIAAPCLSCHRQLGELAKHYKLDIKVDTVAALAEEALIE